MYCINLTIIPQ